MGSIKPLSVALSEQRTDGAIGAVVVMPFVGMTDGGNEVVGVEILTGAGQSFDSNQGSSAPWLGVAGTTYGSREKVGDRDARRLGGGRFVLGGIELGLVEGGRLGLTFASECHG